jgi:hypothetical protein
MVEAIVWTPGGRAYPHVPIESVRDWFNWKGEVHRGVGLPTLVQVQHIRVGLEALRTMKLFSGE